MIYVTLNDPDNMEGLMFRAFKSERNAIEHYNKQFEMEGCKVLLKKYHLKAFKISHDKPTNAQGASLLQSMGLPASSLKILSPWKTRDNNYWVTSTSDIFWAKKIY